MGVFDKFLDIMKLNDDDYDDDEFYDDDDFADDGDFEEKPRRSFFGKKNNKEESFNDFDADEDKTFQPSASSKVTPMRPAAKHGGSVPRPGGHGRKALRGRMGFARGLGDRR